jgi:HSP20 family protein
MADVNVEKRRSDEQENRGSQSPQRRQQGQDIATRDFGRGLWRDPLDFFTANPFTMMRRFTEELDRAFSGGGLGFGSERIWSPAIEVSEREGKMMVRADLPGLKKDDVKIECTDDGLTIQGERKREHQEESGGFRRSERSYGSFYRYIPLPEGANTEQAQANLENGVLEVSIPVPGMQKNRREIPVQSGTGEKKQVGSQGSSQQGRESKAG